jgi:transglutaminase-like putative cysteine protease
MRYRIRHRTAYHYSEPVAISHNVLHLAPRQTPYQQVLSHRLTITPRAATRDESQDWYRNNVVHATVQEPHTQLIILAESEITVVAPVLPQADQTQPWEQVVAQLSESGPGHGLHEAVEFRFASAYIPVGSSYAAYARPSFTPGRPVLAAALDLTKRIRAEFTYDPAATNNETPVDRVLAIRRGVCQDFAHLQIACLRSLGLGARYVSGYLETQPPAGQQRMIGADASHAWLQIHVPGFGWVDLDPTNGIAVADRHATVAWGRDVGDVSPTKGMILGGGHHTVQVGVDVEPIPDAKPATGRIG